MSEPLFVIPADRLPAGFAEEVERPVANPVEPKPAATVVLLRDGSNALEVLLLKRHRASGFVPGAYVFPGGRTDAADADARLLQHVTHAPPQLLPHAFWFAAVREVFEETGVLLARDSEGGWAPDTTDSEMEERRLALMNGDANLLDVLQDRYQVDFGGIVYFAHWITPLVEPRRYDTRFLAAVLPAERRVQTDAREMTDALWLPPAEALSRFAAGRLPMVFPTVRTLETLAGYHSTQDALTDLRQQKVEPIMPRLVRTGGGVGIVIDPK